MNPPPEYNYELQSGEDWVTFDDLLLIAHPDRPVKVVRVGGKEESFRWHASGTADMNGVPKAEE